MGLSITFTNFSGQNLNLGYTEYNYTGAVGVGVQTSPSSPLQAVDGFQEYSVYIDETDVTGFVDLICCWYMDSPAFRFGLWLHFPAEVIGIGTKPYWKVMSDTNTSSPNSAPTDWTSNGHSTSDTYQWPNPGANPSTDPNGFQIVAVPTSGGSSLSVAVTIQDPLSSSSATQSPK